jgi:hypothetical protein
MCGLLVMRGLVLIHEASRHTDSAIDRSEAVKRRGGSGAYKRSVASCGGHLHSTTALTIINTIRAQASPSSHTHTHTHTLSLSLRHTHASDPTISNMILEISHRFRRPIAVLPQIVRQMDLVGLLVCCFVAWCQVLTRCISNVRNLQVDETCRRLQVLGCHAAHQEPNNTQVQSHVPQCGQTDRHPRHSTD